MPAPVLTAWLDHGYLAVARDHVGGGLDEAGAEAAFPKRPRAPVSPVEIAHIAAPEISEEVAAGIGLRRRKEQVHMVRHQAIRVDLARILGRCCRVESRAARRRERSCAELSPYGENDRAASALTAVTLITTLTPN